MAEQRCQQVCPKGDSHHASIFCLHLGFSGVDTLLPSPRSDPMGGNAGGQSGSGSWEMLLRGAWG